MDHVLAVTTRAQATQREQDDERIAERERVSGANPSEVKPMDPECQGRQGAHSTDVVENSCQPGIFNFYSQEDARSIGSQEARKDRTTLDVSNRPKLQCGNCTPRQMS